MVNQFYFKIDLYNINQINNNIEYKMVDDVNAMSTSNPTINANTLRNSIINTSPKKYEFNTQIKQPSKCNDGKCNDGKCNDKSKLEKKSSCCPCYNKDSFDARCCGACYYCCPLKNKLQQCEICPTTFTTYWNSGYIQTDAGYGKQEKNGVCCWFCFPVKFTMFFTCFLGSLCNSCINGIRDTELNYLL